METTATRLKQLMEENNWRQVDILNKVKPYAKKYHTKINKSDISQYVNGKVNPGQNKLSVLGEALGVTEGWLMGLNYPKYVENNEEPTSMETNITSHVKNSTSRHTRRPQIIRIPIYEAAAAGKPILMNSETSSYAVIPEEWTRGSELFGVRIRGDSMEPLIHDNDVVVVRRQSDADTGDIVIVSMGNEIATCKKLEKNEDGITLVPINSMRHEAKHYSSKDIEREQIQIIGKVKVSITNF